MPSSMNDGTSSAAGEQNSSRCPALTLAAIRAGLRVERQGGKVAKPPPVVTHDENVPAEIVRQVRFTYELLELAKYLESLQQERVGEWEDKTTIVRQFEDLYDSVRHREALLPHKVHEQQEKFEVRRNKYDNLTKRAEKHLSQGQSDRDRVAMEAVAVEQKVCQLREELKELQVAMEDLQSELETARVKAQLVPSEREVMELQLRLRRLRNDNAQLLTDNDALRAAVHEVASCTQQKKLVGGTSTTITTLLSSVRIEDPSRVAASFAGNSLADEKVKQVEKQIVKLKTQIEDEASHLESEMALLMTRRQELQQYVESLEAMLIG